MKVIFFLDQVDANGKVVEANIRALEVLPEKLQLRQVAPDQTWLALPVGEPAEGKFVPLIPFPIGLHQATPEELAAFAQAKAAEAANVAKAKKVKKAKGKAK